jgi:hypothetical protein
MITSSGLTDLKSRLVYEFLKNVANDLRVVFAVFTIPSQLLENDFLLLVEFNFD